MFLADTVAEAIGPVEAAAAVGALFQVGFIGVRDTFSEGCLEVLFESAFATDAELRVGDEDGLELRVVD